MMLTGLRAMQILQEQRADAARRRMQTPAPLAAYQSFHSQMASALGLRASPRTHTPKPKMRQIGDAWMCWSSTHAAVEPTAEAAYKRWEGML